jgi:hypothetical protein
MDTSPIRTTEGIMRWSIVSWRPAAAGDGSTNWHHLTTAALVEQLKKRKKGHRSRHVLRIEFRFGRRLNLSAARC